VYAFPSRCAVFFQTHPPCHLKQDCCAAKDLPVPQLPSHITKAFDVAFKNISSFHRAQAPVPLEVETMPGVCCRRISRPIGERQDTLQVLCLSTKVPAQDAVIVMYRALGRCQALPVDAYFTGTGTWQRLRATGNNKFSVQKKKMGAAIQPGSCWQPSSWRKIDKFGQSLTLSNYVKLSTGRMSESIFIEPTPIFSFGC
jgi:hypothetical protein